MKWLPKWARKNRFPAGTTTRRQRWCTLILLRCAESRTRCLGRAAKTQYAPTEVGPTPMWCAAEKRPGKNNVYHSRRITTCKDACSTSGVVTPGENKKYWAVSSVSMQDYPALSPSHATLSSARRLARLRIRPGRGDCRGRRWRGCALRPAARTPTNCCLTDTLQKSVKCIS